MNPADFYIGLEFFTSAGRWRCTDVGSRTICAISLEPHEVVSDIYDDQGKFLERRSCITDDPSWLNGPPYAIAERVFDEYDIEGCALTPDAWDG